MAIKPVTFQGVANFKSNLYALEVKSRFIDQSKADGYYLGYGQELAASVSGSTVTVGSGAFLVQGRQIEIETGGEAVSVEIRNGYYGYIIARIETFRPSDNACCSIIYKTGASLAAITLTQQDTYARVAETENRVYELPLFSFYMTGGNITNLTKVITALQEAATVRAIANAASETANAASQNASTAVTKANEAKTTAADAVSTANAASETAQQAAAAVDDAIQAAANLIYPVGSIYMSVKNTSPASLFGGSWAAFGAGRALVGVNTSDTSFNTVEKTGGEKTHTLTISEMPSHSHTWSYDNVGGSREGPRIDNGNTSYYIYNRETSFEGGGSAHNNLQPYITVYIWKRVS